MSGGEFGYDWERCPQITGDPDRGLRVQTLVASASVLGEFMQAEIVDEGPPRGKVLKFVNLKDDPDSISISPNQVIGPLDGTLRPAEAEQARRADLEAQGRLTILSDSSA